MMMRVLAGVLVSELRLRAEMQETLCLGLHEIHRAEDGTEMWVTCSGIDVSRSGHLVSDARLERSDRASLRLDRDSARDITYDIERFISEVRKAHERIVAADTVLMLLDVGTSSQDWEWLARALVPAVRAQNEWFDVGPSSQDWEWQDLIAAVLRGLASYMSDE